MYTACLTIFNNYMIYKVQ